MTRTTPIDTIICGDCLEEMKKLPDRSIDAIVTDPPYELAFMGKKWDASGIAYNVDMWGECLRVLKPGGHLLAFGGSRTYHRMACAIEDAGFEIRDSLHWVYSQGFPKSLDISKAIDKAAKAEREIIGEIDKLQSYGNGANSVYGDGPDKHHRMLITSPSTPEAKQWSGYGSALKPAHEPVVLARKPLDGCTIAENVLRWGCGGLNVDGCRIETNGEELSCSISAPFAKGLTLHKSATPGIEREGHALGRFPSNLIHDGSEVVLAEFAKAGESKSQRSMRGLAGRHDPGQGPEHNRIKPYSNSVRGHDDEGSPARFFQACPFTEEDIPAFLYYAKASKSDRGEGNTHSTVKPTSLIRYLCKLITPPGGTILDPFGGSGTTGIAAIKEGFHYILIEQQEEYCEIARKRVAAVPARLDRWAEEGI
jgi:site-specific DNA-methyltransferase (adenine-specific)